MKTRFLFPHQYKVIGWLLLMPSFIAIILAILFDYAFFELDLPVFAFYEGGMMGPDKAFAVIENNVYDELIGILAIAGGVLAAFSEEKYEDEFISKIRLESLLWATYINYGFLLLSILFIYGMGFLQILLLNIFTLLIIFLVRFNFILYRSAKTFA